MHRTPGGGRAPFTERDDRHLIEYLAKQKPEPRGRLGNAVYGQLVENAANRWPWAKNHSWQSWRERYKKNQEEFDHKIRQYQKKILRQRQERLKEEEEEDITNSTSGIRPSNAATGLAEGRQGKGKEPEPTKPSSDLRPQKMSEKAQNNETKIVTSKPSVQSRPQPQKVAKKFEHDARSNTPSKQDLSSRPSKNAYQQSKNGHESFETENERVATEDDLVPSLSENEMHELFGSFVEEEEEEEEVEAEEDQPETSNASRPNDFPSSDIEIVDHRPSHRANIYPNLQNAPTPALGNPEPQVPDAFNVQATPFTDIHDSRTVTKTYPIRPTRPRPKQLRQRKAENPFDTSSDTSSESRTVPAAHPVKADKKLPILEEGPFRTAFKRNRIAAHDASEAEEGRPWPPKRSKKERDAARQFDGITTFAHSRPSPQENAVASSSKTMLPPPNPADDFSTVIPRTLSETSPSYDVSSRPSVAKRPTVGDIANSRSSANTEKTIISNSRHQGRTSALILKPSINKLNNEISITSTSRHYDLPIKPSSDTDPFTAKHQQQHVSVKAAGKARADSSYAIANENESPNPPRHIDLHQKTLSKRRRLTNNPRLSRPGSVLSSHTSFSSSSSKKDRPRKSNSLRKSISELDLPDNDTREFLLAAADSITEALEKMAKDYDFSIDYVEDIFKKARSIEKTNVALKQLRQDLNKLQQETIDKQKALYARINFIAHRGSDENDSDNEVPDGLVRLNLTTTKASGRSSNRSSPRKSKSKRPSLNIKPLLTDEEDDVISDYSPPNSSRAGQFARLVKQGRKQEAIEREKRRASGVFIPATEHNSARTGRSMLAREVTDTPTPHTREVVAMDVGASQDQDRNAQAHGIDDDDDDDMYVHTDDEKANDAHKASSEHENEADDEFEETQQKENGDRSRVLEDSEPPATQSQNVPEPADPRDRNRVLIQEMHDKHRALALEHRLLAMKVNVDNADEMRQFEARNDPDFLRLMSLQLVEDLLASKPSK